jgi:hypothetical protein
MTKEQEKVYEETEALRKIICDLKGRKFRLDCGHHVTFGNFLGSDITIQNDAKRPRIICTLCSY